jgi:NAD(P)-dependent dehydrogenase (short-subunit alcohol dehydrogenase family)
VCARHGRLDILVNNAGMTQVGSPTATTSLPLAELPESEWDYGIAINLKTAFNVTKGVLPSMLTANYGRIVNVSSVTGRRARITKKIDAFMRLIAQSDRQVRRRRKESSPSRTIDYLGAVRILLLNICCFFTSSQNRWRR